MKRMRWLVAAGAAASVVALGAGGALAYGGPPWPSGSDAQVTQQERQQERIQLHEQLGIPPGQPLHLQDGSGPHGPMGDGSGGVSPGPADCPYRTTS